MRNRRGKRAEMARRRRWRGVWRKLSAGRCGWMLAGCGQANAGVFGEREELGSGVFVGEEKEGMRNRGVYAIGGVFPVISLEKEEAVLVNLGQFRFEYAEMERVSSIWEFVKKVNVWSVCWRMIPCFLEMRTSFVSH